MTAENSGGDEAMATKKGGRLADRVGLISGTATGIGAAGARLFASEGAALVTIDMNAAGGRETVSDIDAAGGRALFFQGDVSDARVVSGAVDAAVRQFGKLDLLWSNAAIQVFKTILDTSESEWDRLMAVNVKGAYQMAHLGIPELIKAGGGTVVITASISSFVAGERSAAYTASKAALLGLTRALALDHAQHGIRVNCVAPGATDTPLQEADMRARAMPYEDAVRADQAAHPLKRYATPLEVAEAALFLSSPASSFTTGSTIFVDGGYTAQ
jgi:NAD(P)-dependent dehydrogenase (short-subunit alcohol dehydrogenase family)